MRLFVVYDASGEISTVATQPENAPQIGMTLSAGENSGFIDVAEVAADADRETTLAQINEVRRRYRVSSEPGPLRLAERDETEQAAD
ncbi:MULTISPECIES: hypothetical protein [Streptomyces]|jgi:hypothetical protein|uniref:hypothetical protein n=1 Tax=Streptomyces TaxID=1883 RepID=UPI0004CDB202|nr:MULTISPECIES: hypothetical protein [Streptomyces]